MSSRPLRAVVIGAARRRQGLGPYLARFLDASGVTVAGVSATSLERADAAADALGDLSGGRPAGYDDAAAMCAAERPDIVVIASPYETHAAYLRLADENDAHVLCEKPVCWGDAEAAGEARALGRRFLEAGRHLVINTQWPLTLETYAALYPDVDVSRAGTFWMRMSPEAQGARMIPAAMPHPLSLLCAAAPPGPTSIEDVEIDGIGRDSERMEVRFTFQHAGASVAGCVEVVSTAAHPKPAGYGFDAHRAWREIELPAYAMTLRGDDRVVPMPDPTPLLVGSFVDRVRSGALPTQLDPAIDPGMSHLVAIAEAWHRGATETPTP